MRLFKAKSQNLTVGKPPRSQWEITEDDQALMVKAADLLGEQGIFAHVVDFYGSNLRDAGQISVALEAPFVTIDSSGPSQLEDVLQAEADHWVPVGVLVVLVRKEDERGEGLSG